MGFHLYYCANFWHASDSDLSNTQIPDKKIKKKISSNLSNQQEAGFLWRILPTYNNPGQYLIFRTNRQLFRGSILLANSVIETNCSFLSEIKLEVNLSIFLKINVCPGWCLASNNLRHKRIPIPSFIDKLTANFRRISYIRYRPFELKSERGKPEFCKP